MHSLRAMPLLLYARFFVEDIYSIIPGPQWRFDILVQRPTKSRKEGRVKAN